MVAFTVICLDYHPLRWIHLEWRDLPWQSSAERDLCGVTRLTLTIICWGGSIWSEETYLHNHLLRWWGGSIWSEEIYLDNHLLRWTHLERRNCLDTEYRLQCLVDLLGDKTWDTVYKSGHLLQFHQCILEQMQRFHVNCKQRTCWAFC